MHRGVREFIRWVEEQNGQHGIVLQPAAQSADLTTIEQEIGSPLPADLRLVLGRFNGAQLPSGVLLTAAAGPGATIDAALKEVAGQRESSFLDPDLLLPFARTEHGSVLAFDRSAAPTSDTWPIVDFDSETGDLRLVHRTFDAWCRVQLKEWTAPDFRSPFTLDRYLAQGQRHASVEPDVSVAHVTIGHALRRAGQPEAALLGYLAGARCVPAEPWCDWEAIKLAVVLQDDNAVLEAGGRLGKRAPARKWALRGTTPSRVAFLLARAHNRTPRADSLPWQRIVDHLTLQALDDDDRHACESIRSSLGSGELAPPHPDQPVKVPRFEPPELWWDHLRAHYAAGALRDDDLAMHPIYNSLAPVHSAAELLRIRREF